MYTPTNTPKLDSHKLTSEEQAQLLSLDYLNPIAWLKSARALGWMASDIDPRTKAQVWTWALSDEDNQALDAWHAQNVEDIYGMSEQWEDSCSVYLNTLQHLNDLENMARRCHRELEQAGSVMTKAMRERLAYQKRNAMSAAKQAQALRQALRDDYTYPSQAAHAEMAETFHRMRKPYDIGHGLSWERTHGLEHIAQSCWGYSHQDAAKEALDALHIESTDKDRRAAIMDEAAEHIGANCGHRLADPWLNDMRNALHVEAQACRGDRYGKHNRAEQWQKLQTAIAGLKMVAAFMEEHAMPIEWESGFLQAVAAIEVAESECPWAIEENAETVEA